MVTTTGIYQLGSNSHPLTGATHAALQHGLHSKDVCNFCDGLAGILEGK